MTTKTMACPRCLPDGRADFDLDRYDSVWRCRNCRHAVPYKARPRRTLPEGNLSVESLRGRQKASVEAFISLARSDNGVRKDSNCYEVRDLTIEAKGSSVFVSFATEVPGKEYTLLRRHYCFFVGANGGIFSFADGKKRTGLRDVFTPQWIGRRFS